jgi:hypothetical protein
MNVQIKYLRIETSVYTYILMMFFWAWAPCGLAGRSQRFGEAYCLHLQGWSDHAGNQRDYIEWQEGKSEEKGQPVHTAPKPRRTSSISSPPWKTQISYTHIVSYEYCTRSYIHTHITSYFRLYILQSIFFTIVICWFKSLSMAAIWPCFLHWPYCLQVPQV